MVSNAICISHPCWMGGIQALHTVRTWTKKRIPPMPSPAAATLKTFSCAAMTEQGTQERFLSLEKIKTGM